MPDPHRRFLVLERLFPNRRRIFDQLGQIASHLVAGANILKEGFEEPSRWTDLSASLEEVERQGDELSRAVDLHIEQMLVPPMDREDIHLLSTLLRRVVDYLGGTARRAVSLRITERREPAVQLTGMLLRATESIQLAVTHIDTTKLVLEQCRAVKLCEEEGDAIFTQAVSDLFDGRPDPIEVLRWKTIYDQLEDTLDICEDVANELESIALKHA